LEKKKVVSTGVGRRLRGGRSRARRKEDLKKDQLRDDAKGREVGDSSAGTEISRGTGFIEKGKKKKKRGDRKSYDGEGSGKRTSGKSCGSGGSRELKGGE